MPVRFYTSGPITPDRAQFIVKDLEPGVYDIRSSPELGMFIIRVPDFVLPSKLYGSIEERAARVLNTFKHVRQMGVACFGLKGSGKTLLAKKIALDSGLPVITLNTDFPPNMVESMLETMGPHVLFIDEFEKVFNEDEKQDAFLTVLDGTSQARRLTIITANDEKKIRDPFIRRPGRIHYLFTYSGLTDEEVKTYLDDKLSPDVPAEYRTMIEERAQALAENLNFDILRAMVFEVNLYFNNIPAAKILGGLNVQPPPRTEEWKIIGEWSDPTFDLIVVPGTTVYVESGETALEAFEDIYPFPIMVKNKPKKSIDDDDDDLIVPSVSGGDMDAGKSLYSTLQLRRAEIVAASPKKYTFEYEVIKDGQLQHSALRRVGCAEFISNFYTTLGDSLPRNLSVRFIATRQPERQGFRWSHAF
jgi:hypothetical protein